MKTRWGGPNEGEIKLRVGIPEGGSSPGDEKPNFGENLPKF
jgi:hypothetical protein